MLLLPDAELPEGHKSHFLSLDISTARYAAL